MKEFMSDKEIINHLMIQNFEDDNTFSKCPKGYATLGIYTNKSKPEMTDDDAQFEDLGSIEIKLFDEKTFYEFLEESKDKITFQGIQITFQGIHRLSPVISMP